MLRQLLLRACVLTGLLRAGRATAQAADTLALAHQLTDNKQFGTAAALLARYEQAHPGSIDAVRLHLQLLYWTNRLPEAAALYRRASGQQPAATSLPLDYGRILYETKHYAQAQAVLEPLLLREPGNVEALTMLGVMQYEAGNSAQATGYLNRVLAMYPTNPTARLLIAKIRAGRAPYFQLYSTYRVDNQPLKWLENKLEAGSYRSALVAPTLQLVLWSTRDSVGGFRQHTELLVGNKSTLLSQKLTVQLHAGLFRHAAQPAPTFVGDAVLDYKLPGGFSTELGGSRSPYFYSIASSREAVLFGQAYGALLFQNAKGWQGRAQATASYFAAGNRITGLSAWVLSQALALGPVYVKGGYSFTYNNALSDNYVALLTPARLAATFGQPIVGTYGDYFTPRQQVIHTLLLNADAKAGSRCWLSLKASVGVYATAQSPYLYLSHDQAGLVVGKEFYPERYTPYELKGQASYLLSKRLLLESGYCHTRTLFYTANQSFVKARLSL